jgi:hypothetical protein
MTLIVPSAGLSVAFWISARSLFLYAIWMSLSISPTILTSLFTPALFLSS